MKLKVSHTLESEILRELETFREEHYPGASRSYVIEMIIKNHLTQHKRDSLAVAR